MAAINEIMSQVPLDQLAQQLGTDEQTAEQAARQAIGALMTGMQSNAANDPAAEQSLAQALQQHRHVGYFDSSRIDLAEVDTNDGEKITRHVLGPQAASSQAQQLGIGGPIMNKVLAILAPIVINYVANKVIGGSFGDILGQVLSGGTSQQNPQQPAPHQPGGGLGEILGQILGGGSAAGQPTSPGSTTSGANNPFQPVDYPGQGSEERRMPSAPERPASSEKKDDGGILGDVLDGLFGNKDR